MSLQSSKNEQTFESLNDLILRVNEHAASQDYVVVLLRIKKSKLNVIKKIWLICDRERKSRKLSDRIRRHITSRHIECSFFLIDKREDEHWSLKVANSSHNHSFILIEAHSVHRRMIMNANMQSEVTRQLIVQVASAKILVSLRVSDSVIDVDDNYENSQLINSLLKSRDIYNYKVKVRREVLESLTSIQVLIRELEESEHWIYEMQKDVINHITHLFFMRFIFKTLLKINSKMLIMNCTYKINKYNMSLMIISDQTALHINFYVIFCFMTQKLNFDYCWCLQQLKTIYVDLEIAAFTIIIIDMKRELMKVCETIFEKTNHLLCLWHNNKNVIVKCRNNFNDKEAWNVFYLEWKLVIYVSSKKEFWTLWTSFIRKYNENESMNYLVNIYIIDFRHHFVKAYINQMLHFDIISTSRDEERHSILKRQLESFIEDLKTIVDDIDLLLINELHNHLIVFDEAKIRYFLDLRKLIYQQIALYIISFAIRKIDSQLKLLTERITIISVCTDVFITITGLSCSHRIHECLFQKRALQIKDVHSHWR